MLFYISQVDRASRIDDSHHHRDAPHFTSSYLTHYCCLRPTLESQVTNDSPFAWIFLAEETQICLAGIFSEDPLTRKPCTAAPFEKYAETKDKEERGIPPIPSETGWLRMLQYNTSKWVKRTPSRENLPVLFSLGYFQLAVSCLNILRKTRHLEAEQLLRHLRQCWSSWSPAL